MWKKVRNLAVLASVATSALIVGCQPVQPMDTGFQPVTLTYEYNVGSATTSVDDIYDKLVEAIVGAVTVMPPTQIIPGETDILTVRGQEAKSTCISVGNCTINVSYVNGKFYRSTGSKYLTTQTISIPVKISKNGQVFNAIVELDGTVDTVSEGGFLGASPLLNASRFNFLFTTLSSLRPSIDVSVKYNGEIQLPEVNDVIVYANYQRMMGIHSGTASRDDVAMSSWFRLNTGNGVVPLGVTVYPTRTGALVKYFFEMTYTLTPDGKTNYDPNLISGLKRNIEDVAKM